MLTRAIASALCHSRITLCRYGVVPWYTGLVSEGFFTINGYVCQNPVQLCCIFFTRFTLQRVFKTYLSQLHDWKGNGVDWIFPCTGAFLKMAIHVQALVELIYLQIQGVLYACVVCESPCLLAVFSMQYNSLLGSLQKRPALPQDVVYSRIYASKIGYGGPVKAVLCSLGLVMRDYHHTYRHGQ